MKKLFALLAVVLAVASCQKESNDLAVNMGEQETLITVALPEATRANSALGGLDNNVRADHQLRYILEIYSDGGNKCLRNVKFAEGEKTEVVFNVRLVPGHAYDFVVWADFVKNGEDTYYNTANGLDEISFKNYDAMTEARDAYYNVVSIKAGEPVSKVNTITLTRPFAKVRVIADDVDEAKAALHNSLTKATVTYTDDVVVYNTFNARTQDVSVTGEVSKEKTFFYNTSAYDESNLYVDYILVPQGTQSTVKFDLNVDGFVNRAFKTDIAVEANKLTTIKGNILTNGSDIRVEVKDEFEQPESEIPAELLRVLQYGGEYTFTENLNVYKTLFIKDDTNVTLNLNGHNITIDTENDDLEYGDGIIVYGNLIINDETGKGTVTSKTRAIWARGKGSTVTINGGNYVGATNGAACEVIYASGDGKITINSGTFKAETEDQTSFAAPQYAVLNLHGNGKAGCDIVVYGGSFYKFNPADNVSENPKKDFCAEGCEVTKDGDWYNVTGYTPVATATEIQEALAKGENVTLSQDVTSEAATTAQYGNKYAFKQDGGVIDGNGHELYMECYGDDYGIMTSGGTIKNLTITEGCRAVMIMYPKQDVILDNVNIGGDGVLYPINTGEAGAEGVNLIVTNSVLAGWTSYGIIESASFTNVEFKQGTYYNNIYGRVLKPYVNTTLTNCSFVKHMNLDLSDLKAGHKIVMKNCTVNGQAVTVTTFTIPTTDAQYDTELFTIDLPSWATSIDDCVVFE